MPEKKKDELEQIKLLILDVDGVLTDGTLFINPNGTESKSFNALDGHGIRMWKRAGLKVAFLSGRMSEPTQHRAEQLDIDHCIQDCHHKMQAFQDILEEENLTPQQVCCIGDDLMDVPIMKSSGFSVAVANAVEEVKQHADFITTKGGGKGAVREAIEYILKNTGKWNELVKRYELQ
ncbi:MAG: KdsC family phosphatase [Planctomycetota bacterium]|jgi:3-deoxy-D-manno-octulosonate 8-phosphate phosphatase (KDO 8-P phosphatase)